MADSKIEIVSSNEVRTCSIPRNAFTRCHCVLSRPDVFVPNVEGAWLHPERATPMKSFELAITVDRAPSEATLRTGETFLRATLCRCGASKNKRSATEPTR